MRLFGASLAARRGGAADVPEDGYQGEYIVEWAAEMPDGVDPVEWGYDRAQARACARCLAGSASSSTRGSASASLVDSGAIDATLADLRAAGRRRSRQDGAVWLRTTDFGDDKDRVLVKSDGEPTYLLPDIAYHRDKFARGLRAAHRHLGRRPPRLRAAACKAGVQALGHDARTSSRSSSASS